MTEPKEGRAVGDGGATREGGEGQAGDPDVRAPDARGSRDRGLDTTGDGRGPDADGRPEDRGSGADGLAGEAIGPWRRRSRHVAYENAWIRVLHDEVVRPDGGPGIYGVVHFHGRAVGVVAVDDEGRILLVGQHRYTLDRYSWELPEGGVPEDEDLLDGARRELAEETGYTAAAWRVLVPATHLSNSVTDESGVLYRAGGLAPGPARPDPTEQVAIRWVALEEALDLIDTGVITDSMTQIGLLRHALEQVGRGPRPG